MAEDTYFTIRKLLASTRPEDLHRGLELVKREIARVGSAEARDTLKRAIAMGAVLNGAELALLDDRDLIESAMRCSVFARVTPEHKIRVVQALQSLWGEPTRAQ